MKIYNSKLNSEDFICMSTNEYQLYLNKNNYFQVVIFETNNKNISLSFICWGNIINNKIIWSGINKILIENHPLLKKEIEKNIFKLINYKGFV